MKVALVLAGIIALGTVSAHAGFSTSERAFLAVECSLNGSPASEEVPQTIDVYFTQFASDSATQAGFVIVKMTLDPADAAAMPQWRPEFLAPATIGLTDDYHHVSVSSTDELNPVQFDAGLTPNGSPTQITVGQDHTVVKYTCSQVAPIND